MLAPLSRRDRTGITQVSAATIGALAIAALILVGIGQPAVAAILMFPITVFAAVILARSL